jgi:hypothetical protein
MGFEGLTTTAMAVFRMVQIQLRYRSDMAFLKHVKYNYDPKLPVVLLLSNQSKC